MNRLACTMTLGVLALASPACVDRRINITSEPPGAIVYLNDTEVGRTPVEVNFTYFGTYDVRLNLEGYEPLITSAEAKAPLHEQPVIDFLVLFVPGTKETRIDWHFDLEPEDNDLEGLLQRAEALREQELREEAVDSQPHAGAHEEPPTP